MAEAMAEADWHKVELWRPFLTMTKADIVRHGNDLGVGDLMAMSYSCYEGKEQHCALCGTCQERRSAFRDAEVSDPTTYAPVGLAKLPDNQLQS